MDTKIDFISGKFHHHDNIRETEKYLNEHADIHEKIDNLVWAYQEMGDVIPQNIPKLFSGHNFAYTESLYEIECSYQLLKLSFYKYAFIALRNALELGLLSVYWDKDDNSEVLIQGWHSSQEDTPFKREIIAGLKTIENINSYCNHFDLFSRIDKVFGQLSNFNHTKGFSFSAHNLNNANFTKFNEKAVVKWTQLLEEVVQILLIVHILKYPVAIQVTPIESKFGINGPFGGFLDVHQSEHIKEVLNPEELKVLQEISDNDEGAKSYVEWVNSHPDISEDDFKEQLEEFNSFIEKQNAEYAKSQKENS
jgi:hypothetical protein